MHKLSWSKFKTYVSTTGDEACLIPGNQIWSILKSNETTAIIPQVVLLEAFILNDLYSRRASHAAHSRRSRNKIRPGCKTSLVTLVLDAEGSQNPLQAFYEFRRHVNTMTAGKQHGRMAGRMVIREHLLRKIKKKSILVFSDGKLRKVIISLSWISIHTKAHVTQNNFSCNFKRNKRCVTLQVARKNSRVTLHFATAIVALRAARKVERPSTFRNVARQVACVSHPLGNLQRNFVKMGQSEIILRSLSASLHLVC